MKAYNKGLSAASENNAQQIQEKSTQPKQQDAVELTFETMETLSGGRGHRCKWKCSTH